MGPPADRPGRTVLGGPRGGGAGPGAGRGPPPGRARGGGRGRAPFTHCLLTAAMFWSLRGLSSGPVRPGSARFGPVRPGSARFGPVPGRAGAWLWSVSRRNMGGGLPRGERTAIFGTLNPRVLTKCQGGPFR